MKIIGTTVGTTIPKPNFEQTDPTKGDYIKGDRSFIVYSRAQDLTDEQKVQARENISAATMIDKGLIIQSSTPGSTKYFKLTIDDDGVMTASEIV